MAAVAERTKNLLLGTGVTAPTLRYHPGIVAQAFATLGHLYPGRIRLGLGTGEALNEVPLGYAWPSLKERIERLEEAIQVIRLLWQGDFVTYRGRYYSLQGAKMYTKAEVQVPIYVAAFGPKMGYFAGRHADGFYSFLSQPLEYYRNTLVPAVRKGAEAAGRSFDGMGAAIEMLFSYDEDLVRATESVRFWAGSLLPVFFKYGISDPREIEEHGRKVGVEVMKKTWVVTSNPDEVTRRAAECLDSGFKELVFMSSSPDQAKAIAMLGRHVVPYLREQYSTRK